MKVKAMTFERHVVLIVVALKKRFFNCCKTCIAYNFRSNYAIELKFGGRVHCKPLYYMECGRIGQSFQVSVILAPVR